MQVSQDTTSAHGDFGNNSFLNSMGAFKEAQAARMRYLRRHMKLVRRRFVKAHKYFNAKNKAAASHRLVMRWNRAYRHEVKRHAKAIKAHKFAWRMMKKAFQAKMKATKYHKITYANLRNAIKNENSTRSTFKTWNAKWQAARRNVKKLIAEMRLNSYRRNDAEKKYRRAHRQRINATKIHDHAYLRMKKAIRLHKNRKGAECVARTARDAAAARRRSAHARLRRASHNHRRAINRKRAAYRAAIKAHHAVIRHMRKNMSHM